jgi:hypothetical protein
VGLELWSLFFMKLVLKDFYKMANNLRLFSQLTRARFLGPKTVFKRPFIHRTYEDLKKNDMVKIMPSGTAESRRYVLKKDGLPYSFHWTVISKDSSMYIHYKNHQESVMCVGGSAEVEVYNF